jgi:hypothetical protein
MDPASRELLYRQVCRTSLIDLVGGDNFELPPNHLDVAVHSHPARWTRPGGVFFGAGSTGVSRRACNRTMWNERRASHAARALEPERELAVFNARCFLWRGDGEEQSPAFPVPHRSGARHVGPWFVTSVNVQTQAMAAVTPLSASAAHPRTALQPFVNPLARRLLVGAQAPLSHPVPPS